MIRQNEIYNNRKSTPQEVYDSYNNLVFSNDTKVIQKMLVKNNLYNEVKHLNGDIFEFGVFKGASLALWLQLIKLHEPNSLTSVIGFDFFDKDELIDSLDGDDKKLMSNVVNRANNKDDLSMQSILEKCNNILPERTKLIKGNVCETCSKFSEENKGVRIKLLYLDMDLDEPTYIALKTLWEKIVIGGIIVLDEYGFHKWTESNGVDRFLKTVQNKYVLHNTNILTPTMIIKKISF